VCMRALVHYEQKVRLSWRGSALVHYEQTVRHS